MRERAVSFGESPRLTGVVCDPERNRRRGAPVFLLLNAGILHRVGPSRINVRLARALAGDGFASLRFDFSGVGDSEAARDGRSFQERGVAEVQTAMHHLERTLDADRFVVTGLCSGAEVGHATAVADPRVVGTALIDGHLYRTWRYYFHRFAPRLLRGRSWLNLLSGKTYIGPLIRRVTGSSRDGGAGSGEASVFGMHRPPKQEIVAELRALVAREVQMLQVFTGGLDELCTYEGQFRDAFRGIDFGDLLDVGFIREADHTFTSLEAQRDLERVILEWAGDRWSALRDSPPDDEKREAAGAPIRSGGAGSKLR